VGERSAALHPLPFACRFEDPYHKVGVSEGRVRSRDGLGQWHSAESRGRRSLSTADPVSSTQYQGRDLFGISPRVAVGVDNPSSVKPQGGNSNVRLCCCL
jgi:hypothetical protein